MEGINKLNLRKNLLFLKTGLILGKLAKPCEEILAKTPVKILFCTIIYLDKVE